MKTADCRNTYNTLDKHHPSALTISSGEKVRIRTKLNGGDWLRRKSDRWEPAKSQGPNLCTVVAVREAQPGDTLAVRILSVTPGCLGYTGFAGWRNPLSQAIRPNDWDIVTKTVAIGRQGIRWSSRLTLPLRPMIGTIGTAPKGKPRSNRYAWHTGGNMDIQEISAGTTLYLPVEVPGALLHVGDLHAIMGDGEIAHGGGIECAGETVLELTVAKGYRAKKWLWAESADYLMAIANAIGIRRSFSEACGELINWMALDYGFSEREAFLLLSQVMEARCPMLHGGNFSPYICKIPKQFLIRDPQFGRP